MRYNIDTQKLLEIAIALKWSKVDVAFLCLAACKNDKHISLHIEYNNYIGNK